MFLIIVWVACETPSSLLPQSSSNLIDHACSANPRARCHGDNAKTWRRIAAPRSAAPSFQIPSTESKLTLERSTGGRRSGVPLRLLLFRPSAAWVAEGKNYPRRVEQLLVAVVVAGIRSF